MIRTIPTLNGSALAVSALIIAAAALAFDAGRTSCTHPTASSPNGPHHAKLFAR